MLFAVMGFFRPGVDTSPQNLQADFNEHIGQPLLQIRFAGAIQDRQGNRIGYMELMEAESFDRAEAYLRSSPYFAARLYDRVEVGEYALEVGRMP